MYIGITNLFFEILCNRFHVFTFINIHLHYTLNRKKISPVNPI